MKTSKLLSLAFRELGTQKFRIFLYSLSISIGIAALFATGSLKGDLLLQIDQETKSLVGGDLVIKGFAELNDSILDEVKIDASEWALEKSFASMVVFDAEGKSRLANIRAISEGYPIIGEIEDAQGNSTQLFSKGNHVSIIRTLATQFGLQLNDSIRIGNQSFKIIGIHEKAPGQTGISATVAPSVFIWLDRLASTGLVRPGSRIRNSYYFNIPNSEKLTKVYKSVKPKASAKGMRMENLDDGKERLGRVYSNLFRFLNLAAFIALVLGGVGIGSAIDLFLSEKKKMVAVLKCVGFTYRQVFTVFVMQIVALGLVGSVVGVGLGLFIQQFMPIIFEDILIQEIQQVVHWDLVAISFFIGIVISVLFGLKSLIPLFRATPMMALRSNLSAEKSTKRFNIYIGAIQLIVLLLLTWYLARGIKMALSFTGLLFVLMLILNGSANGLRRAARLLVHRFRSFEIRYAINALYRPQNQTVLLISTIGLSIILVLHLFFIRSSLVSAIQVSGESNRPNLIIFDINKESVSPIQDFLKSKNAVVFDPLAIVPMRMHEFKGKGIYVWKEDSLHDVPKNIFDREYRVTEKSELGDNETILYGNWVNSYTSGIIPISIEENFSKQAELEIGDKIKFNVFGSILETQVASIRQVDFTQMRESFTLVFPKGSLEGAPVMYAVSANISNKDSMSTIQNQLVDRFRNISVIDLDLIFESISAITSKIELAIQFMFSFSVLTALIVLINSLFLSRYQRLKENAVLRTIGASSKRLTRINIFEFLIVGILAISMGLILSLIVSWVLMVFVFKVDYNPEILNALILVSITLLIIVLMGIVNNRSLINASPMSILKGNE